MLTEQCKSRQFHHAPKFVTLQQILLLYTAVFVDVASYPCSVAEALLTSFCSQITSSTNINSSVKAVIFAYVDDSVILLILFIIVIMQLLEWLKVVAEFNELVCVCVWVYDSLCTHVYVYFPALNHWEVTAVYFWEFSSDFRHNNLYLHWMYAKFGEFCCSMQNWYCADGLLRTTLYCKDL